MPKGSDRACARPGTDVAIVDSCAPAVLGACLLLGEREPLVPDRPDVSNGTDTVPAGAVQLELGVELASPERSGATPPAVGASSLRIGLLPQAELRLFDGDAIAWAVAGAGGDPQAAFGMKLRLHDGDLERLRPSIGLAPLVVSRRPGGAWAEDPPMTTLVLLVGQPITRRVGLDLNVAPRVDIARPSRRAWSALVSASLGVTVLEPLFVFGEIYGIAGDRSTAAFGLDGGVIITLTPTFALDVATQAELLGGTSLSLLVGVTGLFDGRRRRPGRERRRPRRRRAPARDEASAGASGPFRRRIRTP